MAATNGTSSGINRVLIIGAVYPATPIIKSLHDAKFDVHVAHPRTPSSPYKQVTYHVCDLYAEQWKALFAELKPDVVISVTHANNFNIQKEIVDCVVETGIPRFIPYEFGQDSLNQKVQERLPQHRGRARMIEHLEQLSAESKLSWVGIATGIDIDRGLLKGNMGIDIKWQSATLHGQGDEHFAASTGAWIGHVVLGAVQHWDSVENQYIYACGLTTTGNDLVAAFEKATDREFATSRSEVKDIVREGESRIENGYPDAGMFLLSRSVLFDESIGAVRPFEEDDAKKKLGLEAEKLEDIVTWVIHELDHHDHGGCDCA